MWTIPKDKLLCGPPNWVTPRLSHAQAQINRSPSRLCSLHSAWRGQRGVRLMQGPKQHRLAGAVMGSGRLHTLDGRGQVNAECKADAITND